MVHELNLSYWDNVSKIAHTQILTQWYTAFTLKSKTFLTLHWDNKNVSVQSQYTQGKRSWQKRRRVPWNPGLCLPPPPTYPPKTLESLNLQIKSWSVYETNLQITKHMASGTYENKCWWVSTCQLSLDEQLCK